MKLAMKKVPPPAVGAAISRPRGTKKNMIKILGEFVFFYEFAQIRL